MDIIILNRETECHCQYQYSVCLKPVLQVSLLLSKSHDVKVSKTNFQLLYGSRVVAEFSRLTFNQSSILRFNFTQKWYFLFHSLDFIYCLSVVILEVPDVPRSNYHVLNSTVRRRFIWTRTREIRKHQSHTAFLKRDWNLSGQLISHTSFWGWISNSSSPNDELMPAHSESILRLSSSSLESDSADYFRSSRCVE
jgi:hypothetical protein